MSAATHEGTCQVCGRMHKVNNETGELAKHGYKVQFNQFWNVCPGANNKPLELDRTIGDKIHSQQENFLKTLHEKLKSPITHIKLGDISSDMYIYKKLGTSRNTYVTIEEFKKAYDEHVGGDYVESAITDAKRKAKAALESQIRMLTSWLKEHAALLDTIHGSELTSVYQQKGPTKIQFNNQHKAYEEQDRLKKKGIKSTVRRSSKIGVPTTLYIYE